jgi:hypothetical protein
MAVIKVRSTLPNAVRLRVYEMVDGATPQGAVFPNSSGLTARRGGDSVVVMPGTLTEVDADFWAAWFSHNKDGALVKTGAITAENQQEEKVNNEREGNGVGGTEPDRPETGRPQP